MFRFTREEIVSTLKCTCAVIVYGSMIYISLKSDKYEEGEGPTFFFLFFILGVVAIDWIIHKIKYIYHIIKNRFFQT